MNSSPQEQFSSLIAELTTWLGKRAVTADLGQQLNAKFPANGAFFKALSEACRVGLESGWLGNRGEMPLRYGRFLKPSPATNGFSIDVVLMSDVSGPQHVHPNGEIDMVMPVEPSAKFEGHGAGWVVFGPGSTHAPTVVNGTAAVLYALPDGAITF